MCLAGCDNIPALVRIHSLHFIDNGTKLVAASTYTTSNTEHGVPTNDGRTQKQWIWIINVDDLSLLDSIEVPDGGNFGGVETIWDGPRKRLYYPKFGPVGIGHAVAGRDFEEMRVFEIDDAGQITENVGAKAIIPPSRRLNSLGGNANGPAMSWNGNTIVLAHSADLYYIDVDDDGVYFRNSESIRSIGGNGFGTLAVTRSSSGNRDTLPGGFDGLQQKYLRVYQGDIIYTTNHSRAPAQYGSDGVLQYFPGGSFIDWGWDTRVPQGQPARGSTYYIDYLIEGNNVDNLNDILPPITMNVLASSGGGVGIHAIKLYGRNRAIMSTVSTNAQIILGEFTPGTLNGLNDLSDVLIADDVDRFVGFQDDQVDQTTVSTDGAGQGATISSIEVVNGDITAVRWLDRGTGYASGDTLTFTFISGTNTLAARGTYVLTAEDVGSPTFAFTPDYYYTNEDVGSEDPNSSFVFTDDIGVIGDSALLGIERERDPDKIFMLLKLGTWQERLENITRIKPENIPDNLIVPLVTGEGGNLSLIHI